MPAPFLPQPIGGVYVLIHTATNKGYVGQSGDLGQRLTVILNQLAQGLHNNAGLQADYNIVGDDGFKFKILRRVDDPEERLDAEHEIIREAVAKKRKLYNKHLDRDDGRDWR